MSIFQDCLLYKHSCKVCLEQNIRASASLTCRRRKEPWEILSSINPPYPCHLQLCLRSVLPISMKWQPLDATVTLLFSSHCVWLFVTPWTTARQGPLSFIISWNFLKFMSIESVMLSNHLILCHPLLLLPSVFLSIRVFSSDLALCNRWPKYWSFSISPSNEYLGLISFRNDW